MRVTFKPSGHYRHQRICLRFYRGISEEGIMSRRVLTAVWLAAVASFSVLSLPAQAEAPYSFEATPGKLPKDVVPESYAVHIVPDLTTYRFSGTETVEITVKKPTSQIVLNALNLEIEQATLRGSKLAEVTLTPKLDAEQQTLSFALAQPLPAGRYTLAIAYRGVINAQPEGLYYDKYTTAAGEKVLLGSQMEPTDARRLLPCWDEPSFRAQFQLSVDLPTKFKAFSNTPIQKTIALGNDKQRIDFGATPKMASYLVVLVAGELERISGQQDGTQIGVVTTEGKQATAAYSLKISQQLLHYYNDYFGVKFPLPKLDQIATPGGFQGAMENWGGIVYNETALLYDPKKSTDSTKQRVYVVVSHEMAHQWFGDLVTTAWWDNLWLNEGFASWMETKATDHFNPDWDFWLRANEDRETAMALDARKTTHPIQQPVANESEANDAFDQITYLKGQSFLRMLETYLGADDFRTGIRAYMQKHSYSNTTTADLWAALEKSSGKPVAKLASDWTSQPGFPVVKVDAVCESGQRHITLTQAQFSLDDTTTSDRLWSIPVEIGTVGGKAADKASYTLLQGRSTTVTRPGCDGALVLDPGAVGYYRVQYAPALFGALSAQYAKLPASVRLKLLSDTWALVAADRQQASAYLDLLSKLGTETKAAVWDAAIDGLGRLDTMMHGEALREPLHRYAIALLAPKFAQLGWTVKPGEPFQATELRAKLLRELGDYGDKAVIAEAQKRFQAFLIKPESLPASIIDPVVRIAGRYADTATYDALLTLAQKALTSEEKSRYYGAIGSAEDPKLAERSLPLALSADVPPLFANRMVSLVSLAGEHEQLAWAYAKAHGDELVAKVAMFGRNRYFPTIVSGSSDPAVADDLEAYVKAHLPPEALTETHRTVDAIRIRAKLKARVLPQVAPILNAVK